MNSRNLAAAAIAGCCLLLPAVADARVPSAETFPGEAPATADLVPPALAVKGAPADFLVPRDSCLAVPTADKCPPIPSSVEYLDGTSVTPDELPADWQGTFGQLQPQGAEAEPITDVAPDSDAPNAFTSYTPNPLVAYGDSTTVNGCTLRCEDLDTFLSKGKSACALKANEVSVYKKNTQQGEVAQSTTFHRCDPIYAYYHEFSGTIQRYVHGSWQNLAANGGSGNPGLTGNAYGVIIEYNCNHYKTYPYRNYSTGYHETYSGKAYTTSAKSASSGLTCVG